MADVIGAFVIYSGRVLFRDGSRFSFQFHDDWWMFCWCHTMLLASWWQHHVMTWCVVASPPVTHPSLQSAICMRLSGHWSSQACSRLWCGSSDDANARPHRTRAMTDFLGQGITRFYWPADSRDLASMEHTCDRLGRKVWDHHTLLANIQDLGECLD